jgi:hypothetical protein
MSRSLHGRSRARSVVLAAAALALALIAPAHAAVPQHEQFEFGGEGVFFEGCPGGYDVLIEFAVSGRATLFFDRQDELVRIKEWSSGTGTISNSEDPSKTLTGSSPVVTVWNLRDMTFTVRGMSLHNNIPGEGRVAQETGVVVFELLSFDLETGEFETGELLHSGGKHPEFDDVDWCSMVD